MIYIYDALYDKQKLCRNQKNYKMLTAWLKMKSYACALLLINTSEPGMNAGEFIIMFLLVAALIDGWWTDSHLNIRENKNYWTSVVQ